MVERKGLELKKRIEERLKDIKMPSNKTIIAGVLFFGGGLIGGTLLGKHIGYGLGYAADKADYVESTVATFVKENPLERDSKTGRVQYCILLSSDSDRRFENISIREMLAFNKALLTEGEVVDRIFMDYDPVSRKFEYKKDEISSGENKVVYLFDNLSNNETSAPDYDSGFYKTGGVNYELSKVELDNYAGVVSESIGELRKMSEEKTKALEEEIKSFIRVSKS